MLTTIADYEKAGNLSTAEGMLIAAVRAGQECILSTMRPDKATNANTIRADLLALLITGGANGDGLHPEGVTLQGGYITGQLTLTHRAAVGDTGILDCHFDSAPEMRGAKFTTLALSGSHLPGLNAQGVEVAQSLFLRNAEVTGTTDLNSARIGGQLDCEGATFDIKGDVALTLQSAVVGESLIWRQMKFKSGTIVLAAATAADLVDDLASWPKAHNPAQPSQTPPIVLTGFTYTHLFGSTRAKNRLPWLAAGSYSKGQFTPQPYTQLAKVLREMGHDREARIVLMDRERRLAQQLDRELSIELAAAKSGNGSDIGMAWLRLKGTQIWHFIMGNIAGFGYAPHFALFWAIGAVLVGMALYFIAYKSGAMVPNSAIILTSADWTLAYTADPLRPAWHWAGQSADHYETFYALLYSLDVFLPVVDLGQHSAWTQSTVTWLGLVMRYFTWVLQGAGYLITGLGLATITGWIQKDRG